MAGFVNQGTVKRRRGVKFYALAAAVCVHVAALSIFAVVKLSQTAPVPLQATAVVSISQARQLAQSPAVIPKPKVISSEHPVIRKIDFKQTTGTNGDLKPLRRDYQPPIVESKNEIKPETYEPADNEITAAQVEFFDSTAKGRRICYVVDCSGSMQGLWRRVRDELFESISRLQPDQYFCVIVFGAGSILESNGGRIARATEQTKKDACGFIDSLRPAGTTNAMAALSRAIKVRDNTGEGASVIYFLTDGFELNEQDGSRFAHQVATMLRSFSPRTQINTIGLWPSEQDGRTLERIAKESNGQCTLIGHSGRENTNNDLEQ